MLVRDTATLVGKVTARLCRCFRIPFGVQFGSRASTTLTSLMVSRTSSRLLSGVQLQAKSVKIHRPPCKCLNHCGFRRIIYRLKPSIVTIIQDLPAYSEFDRATSCGVNKAVSESRFPSLAFSSSTAIIPSCLGTLAWNSTGHSSDKLRRRFALASSARSLGTCHCKLSRFYSWVLSLIRVGKKGSGTPCRQHLEHDPAKSFRMPMASISMHWLIVISSGLTDFLGCVPEARLECCSVRLF